MPYIDEWDMLGDIPSEIYHKAGQEGIIAALLGNWPSEYLKDQIVCSY